MKLASCMGLALFIAATASSAATVTIVQQIAATDNLYYTDWGHWWYGPTDGDRLVPSNPDGALNDGTAAKYVSFNNQPYAFNTAQLSALSISVSGSVYDFSPTVATDANGCSVMNVCRPTEDPIYKGSPTYSVVGLWSTTFDHITPVKFDSNGVGYAFGDAGYDDEDFFSTTASPFFIGTNKIFDLTKLPTGNLYLFLAENDGGYSDNSGYYTATISVDTVPLPSSAILMLSAVLSTLGVKLRRKS